MIEYQAHWPLQKPICMMTIACLLMLIIHVIQDMHRSENLAYRLISLLSHEALHGTQSQSQSQGGHYECH